jgi:glycosyltransferase involved in cell wall biosynthesis
MDVNTHLPFFTDVIAPKLKENPQVTLTGFLQGAQKAQHLGMAKAFLFPIHWEEPFGMVMIEAMACGTPVIAYNRGSVPEIVIDGVTGFIIDPPEGDDTPYPLGQHIIKARGVDGIAQAIKRIGEIDRSACRKHVEDHFTVEKMVEGYERVYQDVLSKNTSVRVS